MTPFVPLEEVSVVSRSKLLEAADGVLDPVMVGDWIGDSFTGDGIEEGEATRAFSLPVTASEMALRPMPLRALETEFLIWSDS